MLTGPKEGAGKVVEKFRNGKMSEIIAIILIILFLLVGLSLLLFYVAGIFYLFKFLLPYIIIILLIITLISWIFTGRPPLVSILFRIICLLGVGVGITLLVNKYIIIDTLQHADTLLHEFILEVSNPQTEDNRVLSLHILESLRYIDTLIHNLIDILPKNPLQLIGISISLGFLSELSAGIRNKNIITINNASAEKDKNDK